MLSPPVGETVSPSLASSPANGALEKMEKRGLGAERRLAQQPIAPLLDRPVCQLPKLDVATIAPTAPVPARRLTRYSENDYNDRGRCPTRYAPSHRSTTERDSASLRRDGQATPVGVRKPQSSRAELLPQEPILSLQVGDHSRRPGQQGSAGQALSRPRVYTAFSSSMVGRKYP
jgi:hypothetical protein